MIDGNKDGKIKKKIESYKALLFVPDVVVVVIVDDGDDDDETRAAVRKKNYSNLNFKNKLHKHWFGSTRKAGMVCVPRALTPLVRAR